MNWQDSSMLAPIALTLGIFGIIVVCIAVNEIRKIWRGDR